MSIMDEEGLDTLDVEKLRDLAAKEVAFLDPRPARDKYEEAWATYVRELLNLTTAYLGKVAS